MPKLTPKEIRAAGDAVESGAKWLSGKVGELLGGTTAERMARAAEQGYDTSTVFYHGGSSDFEAFHNGRRSVYLSDDPKIAGIYADNADKRWQGQNNASPNIVPVYVKGKPLVVSDLGEGGGGWYSDNMAKALGVNLDGVGAANRSKFLDDEARRQGYGYVEIQNMGDLGGDQTQIRLLDPGNARSVNADFNPANKDSSNLLASAAPYLMGGAALAAGMAPDDAEAGTGHIVEALVRRLGGTQAERMARAAEQGYELNYPMHHANESGVIENDEFDISRAGENFPTSWSNALYFGDRRLASHYGDLTGEYYLRNADRISARDALLKGYENDKTEKSFDDWMQGIEDSFGIYGWMEQGFADNLDSAITNGKDSVIVDFAGTPAGQKYAGFTRNPSAIRDVNADFNPANRDSPNLLGFATPEALAATATATAAGIAANNFYQRRASKADYWKQKRAEVLEFASSLPEAIGTALDMPLRGYMGLSGVAGTLAAGGGFNQALQQGARIAAQPTDTTAYQYGQAVTDTLSPYVPDQVAAGAGALTNAGVLLGSPL